MKHGKKPTVAQAKFLQARKLNWENWLVERDTPEAMVIVHRYTGKSRTLMKPRYEGCYGTSIDLMIFDEMSPYPPK